MTTAAWVVAYAAYAALEYWLGKTKRVKPNSAVEAIFCGAKSAAGFILSRKK